MIKEDGDGFWHWKMQLLLRSTWYEGRYWVLQALSEVGSSEDHVAIERLKRHLSIHPFIHPSRCCNLMSVNKNLVNAGRYRRKKISFLWSSETSSFGMKEVCCLRFAWRSHRFHSCLPCLSKQGGLRQNKSKSKFLEHIISCEIHFQLLCLGHFPYGLFTLQREINGTMGCLWRKHVITHFCQKGRWWHLFVFWVVLALPCWQASQFSSVCHKAETLWILGCSLIGTMCGCLFVSNGFPISNDFPVSSILVWVVDLEMSVLSSLDPFLTPLSHFLYSIRTWRFRRQWTTKSMTPCRTLVMVKI